jgi:hypothetical protein
MAETCVALSRALAPIFAKKNSLKRNFFLANWRRARPPKIRKAPPEKSNRRAGALTRLAERDCRTDLTTMPRKLTPQQRYQRSAKGRRARKAWRRENLARENATPAARAPRARNAASAKGRAAVRHYVHSAKGKATARRAMVRYQVTPKGRARNRRANTSPRGNERRWQHAQTPKARETKRRHVQSPKGKETRWQRDHAQ